MMKSILRVFVGSLTGMLFAAIVPAQDGWMTPPANDKYVISAKAGGVNFVEGKVTVARKEGRSGYLVKGDRLEIGDKVTTSGDGKAEILLNPGSYVRLGGNSGFEFAATSLDDLEVSLSGGSAVFEVFASRDFKVTVNTPKARMFLIQSGIYRVDVLGDGGGRVSVSKGRAQLADSTIVKGGKQATVSGGAVQTAKFDSDDKDQLDAWSKTRARELARVSQQIRKPNMRNSLWNSFRGNGWNMYSSFGLWAYDPVWGSYCFLPFGYGWNSPYGYGFGPYIGAYNLPPVVYTPPTHNPGGQNTPIAHNPRGMGGQPPLYTPPPFVRIQGDPRAGSSITNGGREIMDSPRDGTSSPVYSPSSAPAVSMPSTTRSDTKKDN